MRGRQTARSKLHTALRFDPCLFPALDLLPLFVGRKVCDVQRLRVEDRSPFSHLHELQDLHLSWIQIVPHGGGNPGALHPLLHRLALLDARAGTPPSVSEILRRHHVGKNPTDLLEFLHE